MKERILNTRLAEGQLALFYLGQEGVLVKHADKYLLFDPFLTYYVDRTASSAAVPWVRKYAPPIAPEALDFIDYVFCSHEHGDHTDPWSLTAIAKASPNARFIVPAPLRAMVSGFGINENRILPAIADQVIDLPGASVLPVPAAHEQLEPDAQGLYRALGYRVTLGENVIYHAGDSCLYDGLEARLGQVDVAMLPVNGRDYYRLGKNIIGNMDVREAAILAAHVQAKLLLPLHFDLYPVNEISPAVIADELYRYAAPVPFHICRPGERVLFAR